MADQAEDRTEVSRSIVSHAANDGHFVVRLRIRPTDAGGRRSPVFPGYRPDWDVGNVQDGEPTINGAMVSFEQPAHLAPGEEGTVCLHPLAPEFWKHVVPGQRIKMYEGARVVGEGVVLQVVPAGRAK